MIPGAIGKRWPWLQRFFADGACERIALMDKAQMHGFVVEIVKRPQDAEPGFHVLPRRRVVERSIGWMTRWRRLVRDCETRIDVSKAMIDVGIGSVILRRIAHP